jgi:amino acid transporter
MFFIIAASAPLTAVAGGQAATYLVTGNRAVAFMFIPLGIVLALFAALLSFHNAVARYAFALGREGVLPSVFSRVNSRTGAPWIASLTQSILALTVVLIFAIAAANPVLTLFTWLTNLGALGVLLLMAATSFAVVGYFRRRPEETFGSWAATWAPALAGVLLLVLLTLGVANFNVLITGLTDAPIDTMTIVLPVILFGGGIVGLIVGATLKRRRPDVYERIGGGAGVEE